MKRGVAYLNSGGKCVVRLCVSMKSLRDYWDGPVTLFTKDKQPKVLLETARRLDVSIIELPNDTHKHPMVLKAGLWRWTPYDTTVFLDADTLIVGKLGELFESAEKNGFCVGAFAGWKTSGRTISKRIRGFGSIVDKDLVARALNYGPAVNTGVFGFTKGAAILEPWEALTRLSCDRRVSRIPDEVACQVLLPDYKAEVVPEKWNISVKYGGLPKDARIIHYHGRKHVSDEFPACSLWKTRYWELRREWPEMERDLDRTRGDRRLDRYLHGLKDVTVVTAVNRAYLSKLKKNYPKWKATDGLREYPLICFVHGIPLDSPELDFMRDWATLVEWDYPGATSERERMLAAFVLGAPKEVKTSRWIKLDADMGPGGESELGVYKLSWPREAWKKVAFGHRCAYTKSKAPRPGADKHFLNILDEWWESFNDEGPIFPPGLARDKLHKHDRFSSWISMYDTRFTRELEGLCKYHGWPVPSQDTFVWYCAERLNAGWGKTNMKKRFKAV